MKTLRPLLTLLLVALATTACSDKVYVLDNDQFILGLQQNHHEGSTVEGNLITSALREMNQLDIVFYPSRLLKTENVAFLSTRGTDDVESIVNIYPEGIRDQFMVGIMRGRDVKRFVFNRSSDNFDTDLQVAGMRYHIHYKAGWPEFRNFSLSNGQDIDDNATYRVAISRFYYFSGETFPSYKYRNGLGLRNFEESRLLSARDSLRRYLTSGREWRYLDEQRATVTNTTLSYVGKRSIPQIQGSAHLSPVHGHRVTTRGIVTASGSVQYYPGGEEAYIQCPKGDGNPKTSDAIHLHFRKLDRPLEIGDEIEVTGTVYEQWFESGLSRTGLREITNVKVLRKNAPLPEPILLGRGGRQIPSSVISNWIGNVNYKPELDLDEALDFFESIEGMRVRIRDPRITGFRGGNEEFYRTRPKGYLNLYVMPDGKRRTYQTTPQGGEIVDVMKNDFVPNLVTIISNHLTHGVDTNAYYDVGKIIEGDVVGVFGYEANLFGGAEYAMVIPQPQESLIQFAKENTKRTELTDRPITNLVASPDHLTVAVYNVENLAGNEHDRLEEIGRSIAINLQCPDVISLVEVQDENGLDFNNDFGSAEATLQGLIDNTPCGPDVAYDFLNIDPFAHNDGGQPGGNIQVAYIYNKNRITFRPRGNPTSLMDNYLRGDGRVFHNPMRLFTRDSSFSSARKSLLVEFEFNGQVVVFIANHFNAKLGDSPMWGAIQPQVTGSEAKRREMARKLNQLIQRMLMFNPDIPIVALGDFNAFSEDGSMIILQGKELTNLSTHLLPFNQRYSYNFNGKSQQIDHVFVTNNMLSMNPEFEIPNINTDFMARLADHDPVIARFFIPRRRR
jgi:predicted extracellular nuclease